MIRKEVVISHNDVLNRMREEGTYTADIDDDFSTWFDGKEMIWVSHDSSYNFRRLPEAVKDILKKEMDGRYAIYLDY